ncbi:MAG: nucleotidyltransferase domain-containing protein [Planctomycetota bacterium]|jgi:predicted nucleotidyltransferase
MRATVGDPRLASLLDELGRAVAAAAGGSARIFLFGSHARGDAGRYSDVDILVILPDAVADLETEDRVRDAIYDFSLRSDYIFSALVASESQAEEMSGVGVFAEIEREGVAL